MLRRPSPTSSLGACQQERIRVVHEDVDRAVFHPRRGSHRSTGHAGPRVGFVGRIDTWKGVDVLLEAWPIVREAEPGAQLLVAGPPVDGKEEYYAELQARASALAGVTWLGPVGPDQAAALFRPLDVLAAPSTLPEPYGLVLVEALASGSRVVATDFGGAPEIVARAEPGAGIAVPPNDSKALAAAVTTLIAAGRDTGAAQPHRARSPSIGARSMPLGCTGGVSHERSDR